MLHTLAAVAMQEEIPKMAGDRPAPARCGAARRPLLTIGHSNHPTPEFLALLARYGVEQVADVRSVPYSRFVPQYRKETLAAVLAAAGVGYLFLGAELGGKPRRGDAAAAGRSYAERIHEPAFRAGIAQLVAAVQEARVALLCRERDPLDCHRLHLICRHLAPTGLEIGHILPDGTLEPQRATERRLLARSAGSQSELFDESEAAALERAYDRWWRSP
jgi:uncharacterized protein (DUF488 family)